VNRYRTALALAARGIPVFLCAPNAKRPLTKRGFYDACTDLEILAGLLRREPHANLAIRTGAPSGLVVIDLDCKHGRDGRATLVGFEQRLGVLPATLVVETPSGGEHRYFRTEGVSIRNSAGKLASEPAPGIDVRGDGGYVLCPPSVIDGRAYRWIGARERIETLPAAWLDALSGEPRRPAPVQPWAPPDERDQSRLRAWCVRALQSEARALAATPLGERNDRLWRAAAALGGLVHAGAFDAAEVRRALMWACSTWSTRSPGKDAWTLENGLAFGLAHPRSINLRRCA
jgi:hypothetical protein